ncbi:peptidylprolyl isomerase [Aquimarina aquimarini]|uniref:peptidylprolyl isomerase n=1 Tax=Aquimarina aquimarini TaxID=1191734 RepID=UPI000D54FAE5|nr:peptidylprolyl isomerase [Aquimarina aquimarini]
MYKKALLLFLGSIFLMQTHAQQSKEILFTIDESPVYISEFKRVYLKNIDLVKDDSQKNIDKYFDLFVNYKLKLKEAEHLGLDKKEAYVSELEGYREQLVKGYLTDNKASEVLLKQAYERSLEQINASHILIMLKPNASEKDTIAAYQKIIEAKKKIDQGEAFDIVAKTYSQDPSVSKNNGNLGWFSAFRMVYPFEEAAYSTKIRDVSKPFRTQFGYHIVKVNSREKKLGEVTVAHIMVAINANRTSEEAEKRIIEINQQLAQGVSFSALAKQYSEDPSTAIKGGMLKRFAQGALNSQKFEQAAFALQKKNEISEPLKTQYGWHIIKLIEKHKPRTFEEQKNNLAKRIKRDSRSKLITESFINSLRKKYAVSKNEKAITFFKKNIPDTFSEEKWEMLKKDKEIEKELFSIKKEKYTYKDFIDFLMNNRIGIRRYTNPSAYIDEMYPKFESSTLLQYYEEHLEEDNVDFANVIEEYRDGLLLFDLMESKIWNAAKTDSVAIKEYYEKHKNNYKQNEAYKIFKASSSKHDLILKVQKLLKEKKTIEEVKKEIEEASTTVLFSEEILSKGRSNGSNNFSKEIGAITISEEENFTTLIMVKEILPSRIKTFDEIRGEVINDYQQSIEEKWLDELKEKYSVKVNKKILKKAKKELSI